MSRDRAGEAEVAEWLEDPGWEVPESVSLEIGNFLSIWSHHLPEAELGKWMPSARRLAMTNQGAAAERERRRLALYWLCRTAAPMWLRGAGLPALAASLEHRDVRKVGLAVLQAAAHCETEEDAAQAALTVGGFWPGDRVRDGVALYASEAEFRGHVAQAAQLGVDDAAVAAVATSGCGAAFALAAGDPIGEAGDQLIGDVAFVMAATAVTAASGTPDVEESVVMRTVLARLHDADDLVEPTRWVVSDVAWAALSPLVDALRLSARDLVGRMIAVGRA